MELKRKGNKKRRKKKPPARRQNMHVKSTNIHHGGAKYISDSTNIHHKKLIEVGIWSLDGSFEPRKLGGNV